VLDAAAAAFAGLGCPVMQFAVLFRPLESLGFAVGELRSVFAVGAVGKRTSSRTAVHPIVGHMPTESGMRSWRILVWLHHAIDTIPAPPTQVAKMITMRIRRTVKSLTILAVAATTVLAVPAAVQANAATPAQVPVAPGEGPEGEDDPIESEPVLAMYEGRTINLSVDWEGATVCSEVALDDVRCFATAEESLLALAPIDRGHADLLARKQNGTAGGAVSGNQVGTDFGTRIMADCAWGWTCLWDITGFSGRRLQWSQDGTKKLADWDFRDQAASICHNRYQGGAELTDYRTLQPDPRLFIPADSCYNLAYIDYVWGGSWNNRADQLRLG
jgi:hypothetical protein